MYVVSFRYVVPPAKEQAYLELQRRVARLYLDAGCERYVVLRPRGDSRHWQELTLFRDRDHHRSVEAELERRGELEPLFDEFLRITLMSEGELKQLEFETAIDERPAAVQAER
jgi:hypothetical protein